MAILTETDPTDPCGLPILEEVHAFSPLALAFMEHGCEPCPHDSSCDDCAVALEAGARRMVE